MTKLIISTLLVLSIVAVGQCGCPVACNSTNKVIHSEFDRTASSDTWEYVTSVPLNLDEEIRKKDCRNKCEEVCVKPRRGQPKWPCCKAFSSYVNIGGGTCWCYGWSYVPSWYSSDRYLSGWCESA